MTRHWSKESGFRKTSETSELQTAICPGIKKLFRFLQTLACRCIWRYQISKLQLISQHFSDSYTIMYIYIFFGHANQRLGLRNVMAKWSFWNCWKFCKWNPTEPIEFFLTPTFFPEESTPWRRLPTFFYVSSCDVWRCRISNKTILGDKWCIYHYKKLPTPRLTLMLRES